MPDAATYNAAILACMAGELWARGLGLLTEMMDCGVLPDSNTHPAVVLAYQQAVCNLSPGNPFPHTGGGGLDVHRISRRSEGKATNIALGLAA